MIDIIFRDLRVSVVVIRVLFANVAEAFGQDRDFVYWSIEFLQCLANDFFRSTIAVDVGCVPGIEIAIIGSFEQRQRLLFV